MKKVILDTNIFVAAGFNKQSSSAQIIELINKNQLILIWDQATSRETKKIINQIPPLSWAKFQPLFQKNHQFQGITHPEKFGIVEDHDDRKFAALADTSKTALVTNDDHLLSVKNKLNINIFTPSEYIKSNR